jgi:hypothetical protein
MNRTVTALFVLTLLFCAQTLAQTEAPTSTPTPFDSFGDKIYETDWLARLDGMAVEMQQRPDTKAFIVAYGVPNRLPGWPLRRANWARGVLTIGRGIDPSRVEVVHGGYADEVRYEHWLLHFGETPPVKPFDFAAALTREKTAYKFDQLTLPDPVADSVYDGTYSEYLDDRGRYAPLALALRHDPAARGLVIVYERRRSRAGHDRRVASNIKRAILKAHPVEPDRILAVGGGRSDHRRAEIWIVPPGAQMPKPTPDARRPKQRRRRSR